MAKNQNNWMWAFTVRMHACINKRTHHFQAQSMTFFQKSLYPAYIISNVLKKIFMKICNASIVTIKTRTYLIYN